MGSMPHSGSGSGSGVFRTRKGEELHIHKFESFEEAQDIVELIELIQIPLFKSKPMKIISKAIYITGNAPYHEGLIFKTRQKNYYVAQVYPINFIKTKNYSDAVNLITSFCITNNDSEIFKTKNQYVPKEPISIMKYRDYIECFPNKYTMLKQNCQYFCKKVINKFPTNNLKHLKKNKN